MSQQPLKIRNAIGWNYNVTLEDVLETKKRLKKIGHYEVPDYGLTPYPDRALFDGIKGFQKNAGLKIDGIMKPGGPTERTLNETLLASVANSGAKTADRPLFGKNLLSMDAPTKKPKPLNPKLAMMPQKDKYARPGMGEILEGGGSGGAPRGTISGNSLLKALGGALASKIFQEQAAKKLPGGSEVPPVPANSNTAKTKMDAATKLPPLPGFEPPKRDPKDNKEEYPASKAPPAVFEGYKNEEERKAAIETFPIQDDPMFQALILPAWKGPPELQAYNDKILKALIDGLEARGIPILEKWGGTDFDERYVKNPDAPKGTILGSTFPDVSVKIKNQDGELEIIDANSQTTYGKKRKPTKGERLQIEKLKKLNKLYLDSGEILELPKEGAFETAEDAEKYILELVETYLTERHGPRQKLP